MKFQIPDRMAHKSYHVLQKGQFADLRQTNE